MITQIELRGFQSHVNTVVNLQNGLNVVTGPSDSGKTAIIRAVRWVAFNEPQGEAFVNDNVGEAEVKIILQSGHIITKHRRKGKTSYTVQENENGIESVFEKSEVPLEVARLLGIEKTSFGDFETALNFSFQLDAPFLISETASAGAKVLGKLAGTESVDLAIKGVSKDTHAARNMRSQAEKDMERILGSLFDYEHIDDAKQSLETAEMIFEQVEKEYERLNNLKEYANLYVIRRTNIDDLTMKVEKLKHVPQLIENVSDIEKIQHRYERVLYLQDDYAHLKTRISKLEHEIGKYKDTETAGSILVVTENDQEKLTEITSLRQLYQKYVNDVRAAEGTLEKTKEIKSVEKCINSIEISLNSTLDLRNAKVEYETIQNELNALKKKFEAFRDIHEVENILTAVERDEKRFRELYDLQRYYTARNGAVALAKKILEDRENELHQAKEKLNDAWDEAGGVCPLCEQAHEGEVC